MRALVALKSDKAILDWLEHTGHAFPANGEWIAKTNDGKSEAAAKSLRWAVSTAIAAKVATCS